MSLNSVSIYLTIGAYIHSSKHLRGSLPGEGEDEVEIPVSQPSPMGNPEEDESIEATTRFNILSYPLFTIDGAPEETYDSSDPSKSGSDSPSFNPRPWAKISSPSEKPGYNSSCSLVASQFIPRQGAVLIYPANSCTLPSPHYNYDLPSKGGNLPVSHLPGYANYGQNNGYLGRPYEDVKPFIKQEYVEDNRYW